jgi:pimeloyl-ACP methyl ester carboxylesterase
MLQRILEVVCAVVSDLCLLPMALVCMLWPRAKETTLRQTPARLGVLMLHGSGINENEFVVGRRCLARWLPADVFVTAPNYVDSEEASISDLASSTMRHLTRVKSETGISRWVLVGHSMGGLVGAKMLDKDLDIPMLVTIATPWRGSALLAAKHRWGGLLRPRHHDMLPGSHFLQEIASEHQAAKLVCVGSKHDAMVWGRNWHPRYGTRLASWDYLGHYSLVASPAVWRFVAHCIKKA